MASIGAWVATVPTSRHRPVSTGRWSNRVIVVASMPSQSRDGLRQYAYQARPARISAAMTAIAPATGAEFTVGVDLVDVARFAALDGEAVGRAGVLTDRELAYCRGRRRPAQHMAARFAAKEAVLKAFGTGLARGIRWTDVEVVNASGGRPVVVLHGAVRERADARGLTRLELSLSHTDQLAIAHVIATWATR